MSTVLVTGGMGFIGSHTVVCLLEQGYEVVILDNLCNSSPIVLERIEQITGKKPVFVKADVRDRTALDQVFAQYQVDTVLHFAGLKAVGESVAKPIEYYDVNVAGSLNLLEAMKAADVRNIVFSSSATVYGMAERMPLTEDMPTGGTTNPYGTSKYMVERILMDVQKAHPHWNVTLLRYFNPVGAHESGLIGESPRGIPNNLLPYIYRVFTGELPHLNVFGDDYPTPDGTGVRDYIHVVDLAEGHLKAMQAQGEGGLFVYNLGTGKGLSVLEMVKAFEKACGKPIAYQIQPRRPGDIAVCYADASRAAEKLGWKAQRDVDIMMRDAVTWAQKNPKGYEV